MKTMTLTDGKVAVTIPVSPRLDREGACLDLIILQQVMIGFPVAVRLSLRTDGTVGIWQTVFDGTGNHYAHVDDGYNHNPPRAPTEAQRRTVARWWAGIERPCGLPYGVGHSLLEWAFAGMSLSEMTNRYLDGSHPALTFPHDEGLVEDPFVGRTPWQKGEDAPL